MTHLPPAVEARAEFIRSVHGRAVIYFDGTGWQARAPLPSDALPPSPPPRKSRRELRAERAVLRARRRAKKGSIHR